MSAPVPPAGAVALVLAGILLSGGCGGNRAVFRGEPTLVPSENNPLVAIRVLIRVGSIHDPAAKEGLAALTASLIAEGGSRELTYKQLLEALYPMSASIDLQVDKEVTVATGTIHRDNLERYYSLFRQVLLSPRFDAADFERVKADQINYLENQLRSTDDENLGKETLGSMLYAGHPYGRPTVGTVRGLKAITLADVQEFHRTHYTRRAVALGLAGGYPKEFAARVAADLATLPDADPPPVTLPSPRTPQGVEVLLVTKPTRAWAISIGWPIEVTRADDDFYALLVANSYLGEHRTFNGVLMNKMRGERGFNYGDYSYVESFIQEGGSTFPLANIPRRQQFFSIWIRPLAPGNAHFAIRQALREVDRLATAGMSASDFEATRDFLLNYSRLWVQTASRRLGYEMDGKFYRRSSLVDELQRRLPRMTVTEVNAVARKYLGGKKAAIAVVADPEGAPALAAALRENAPSRVSYETETKPEVLSEDEEIAVWPLVVDAERLRIVPAQEMFEK